MKSSTRGPSRTLKTSCALEEVPGFSGLPAQDKDDLQAICIRRTYGAGQTIVEAGEHADFIGIVSEGLLRMQKTLLDGRQHVVGLLVPGDLFGRVFNGDMHFSLEAATDTGVFAFPRSQFEAILLRSPELDRLLMLNLLNELDRARDWMIVLANPKVRGRVSGFLLLLCSRFQSVDHLVSVAARGIRLNIPISRSDLAHLLGTRVESISRALHALADDGIIEILRPDVIEIRQIEAVCEEAGDPDLGDPASLQRLVNAVQKPSI